MNEVVAEWGGRLYFAKVNEYCVAVVVGGPIEEFQNEGEKAMENENEQQQFAVDVKHFVTTLMT